MLTGLPSFLRFAGEHAADHRDHDEADEQDRGDSEQGGDANRTTGPTLAEHSRRGERARAGEDNRPKWGQNR